MNTKHKRLQYHNGGAVVLSARITFMREDEAIIALIEAAPNGKVAATIRELAQDGFRARRKR